jgi:hypothetical protein
VEHLYYRLDGATRKSKAGDPHLGQVNFHIITSSQELAHCDHQLGRVSW